jgi:hypothetical protein
MTKSLPVILKEMRQAVDQLANAVADWTGYRIVYWTTVETDRSTTTYQTVFVRPRRSTT